MRLGLSSAAAPDATLDELLAACSRRGLAALELRAADAHGVTGGPDGVPGREAVRRASAAGVSISGIRIDAGPRATSGSTCSGSDALVAVARAAGVPIVIGGRAALEARLDRAISLRAEGAEVVVVVGAAGPDPIERILAGGFLLGWDADEAAGDPGDAAAGDLGAAAAGILELANERLHQIRIAGGGPEAAMQHGRGVGALMARLALAGFAGTVLLSPGSNRYHVAWQTWLGRRGGWGCGSRSADRSLVSLEPAAAGGGAA